MKTIELSNEKARILGEVMAFKWANIAVRLPGTTVPGMTPYRLSFERLDSRAFKSRVAQRKREMAAFGDVLTALGVALPTVKRDDVVGPYKSPGSGKTFTVWKGHLADKLAKELAATIVAQLQA